MISSSLSVATIHQVSVFWLQSKPNNKSNGHIILHCVFSTLTYTVQNSHGCGADSMGYIRENYSIESNEFWPFIGSVVNTRHPPMHYFKSVKSEEMWSGIPTKMMKENLMNQNQSY